MRWVRSSHILESVCADQSNLVCSSLISISRDVAEGRRYYAAPTIHHAILGSWKDSGVSLQDIHIRMVCNAAGDLVPSLASRMKEMFTGAIILPSYGMTESVRLIFDLSAC